MINTAAVWAVKFTTASVALLNLDTEQLHLHCSHAAVYHFEFRVKTMSFCHKFQRLWWLCLIFSRYLLSYWRCFSRYMLYNRGFCFSRSLLSRMYLLFLSRFASAECQALRPLVPGKASPCARPSPHAGIGNKRKTTQLIITVSRFCVSLSHRRSLYTDGNPPHCVSRQKISPAEDFKMAYWDLQWHL